jgi:hypothetical protein
MADAQAPARHGWTEEELALLGHSDLAENPPGVAPGGDRDDEANAEHGRPGPAGFRERLVLGDISW